MFVASTLYNLARGVTADPDDQDARSENVRVKRPARTKTAQTLRSGAPEPYYDGIPSSPPPPYEDINLTEAERAVQNVRHARMALIDQILEEQDLYKLLDVSRTAKLEEIRRGFLMRSRVCHPDKFPDYPPSTVAFQRISEAYATLSTPSSRRLYDISGRSNINPTTPPSTSCEEGINDETLNGVLRNVFFEFLDGDFEMIRVMINALNEANPGLDLGEDAVQNFEGVFESIRAVVLTGQKYFRIIRFELIRLYETQHALRQLSYFDVFGRLRLTLQLARVTLNIPMAIDRAMIDGTSGEGPSSNSGKSGELGEDAPHTNSAQSKRKDGSRESPSSDSDDASEDDNVAPGPEMDFGVTDDAQETARRQETKARHRAAAAARAARKSQRSKRTPQGHIPEHPAQLEAWGLLGPSGRGLLGGIVKALEASENWVPGTSGTTAPEYS